MRGLHPDFNNNTNTTWSESEKGKRAIEQGATQTYKVREGTESFTFNRLSIRHKTGKEKMEDLEETTIKKIKERFEEIKQASFEKKEANKNNHYGPGNGNNSRRK